MSKHHCPKCDSTNVAVGLYVLSCSNCGWNHNNDRPCEICGQPSVSACSGFGEPVTHYRCAEHPTELITGLVEYMRTYMEERRQRA